jgi:hypothetical protein
MSENKMSKRIYRITVYRYPFDKDDDLPYEPYETELEAYNTLTDRVTSADELIREKLLEDPYASKVIKLVDEINTKPWARANEILLAGIELYLTRDEWKKIITETIKAYKTRIKILEEYLEKLEEDDGK